MRGVMEVASSMMAMDCVKEKVNVSSGKSGIHQWPLQYYRCHSHPF